MAAGAHLMFAVWTEQDLTRLRNMAKAKVSRARMGVVLNRSQRAVCAQLRRMGLLG